MWSRLLPPTVSFGLALAVIAALLVGFGGQHPSTGRSPRATGRLGPFSAPAMLRGRIAHASTTTQPDTAMPAARGYYRRHSVHPLTVGGPPVTVVTHPTPTTTVTTVTVKPTPTTTVTTVTTTTIHPAAATTTIHPTVAAVAPTTTTTVKTTTTTTAPAASDSNVIPDAPASLGAPSTVVLDDEFNTGALNESLWSPTWFANGSSSNGTTMESSNVAVGANGLALTLANGTGGLVSTNPADAQPGHTGFQIAPSAGKPVYVEFKSTVPASSSGNIANWPALWLDGQTWPQDGEIDVMEGLGGTAAYHIHYGSGSGTAQGANANSSPGTHTYGVLWTTTGVTFVYDGAVVGTLSEALTNPMYLIMENSVDSGGPSATPATLDVRYVRVWQ
jgi:hypothetical protein